MAAGSRAASWVYRRSNGRIGGSVKGLPVLLLTVTGRKTGRARSAPVAYFEHGDGYVLAGTAGGAKTDPQWIHNLAAAGQASIQVREHRYDVDARIAESGERDELWKNVILTRAPSFSSYEEKSGRPIPIAVLTPHS